MGRPPQGNNPRVAESDGEYLWHPQTEGYSSRGTELPSRAARGVIEQGGYYPPRPHTPDRQMMTRNQRDRRHWSNRYSDYDGANPAEPVRTPPKLLKIKPPQFDGKNTLEAFLAQFRIASLGNGWNVMEMGLHLAASLTGSASELLATVDVTSPGGYDRLIEELKARYFCTARSCQRQLTSRRWEKGENLRSLGDDILRLTCRAHPELPRTLREELASSYFLSSLNDENTRHFVILSHPSDYHGHVTAAIEAQPLEAAKGLPRPVLSVQADTRVDEPRRGRYENRERNGNNKRREGTNTGTGEERPPPICWICRGGHFQRFCPEVAKLKESFSQNRRGTVTPAPSPAAAIEPTPTPTPANGRVEGSEN